eukprot:scaffold8531_cov62-Phaeocystis_antarctica.AAC.9
MGCAGLAQACQRRPSIGHRVVRLERVRNLARVKRPATHVNLAVHNGRGVRMLDSRHRCQLLPAVSRRVVHIHAIRGNLRILVFRILLMAAHHVYLTVDHCRGVTADTAASHRQARHPSPRTGEWIVSFDCVAKTIVTITADRIDLASYRRSRKGLATLLLEIHCPTHARPLWKYGASIW